MSAQHNPFSALREAARARRAAERDDASWVERAAGRLSPEDEAALEARTDDPVVELMRIVTTPATQAEQGGLEASVLDALGSRARVVPLRPKRSRLIAVSAAILAAAAAVLLIVRSPSSEQVLPHYEGSLSGTDVAVRSAAQLPHASRARVSPGAFITLTAQPVDAPPEGLTLAARLFVVQGGSAALLDVPLEVTASGTVRVAAPYARLFGERHGELDLLLFVGSSDALPDADQALTRAEAPGSGLEVLRFALAL